MIEINLLPQESKDKIKKRSLELPQLKIYLYLVPLLVGILVCLHIYLAVFALLRNFQYQALSAKWERLKPERAKIEVLKKNYTVASSGAEMIQRLAGKNISWSEKLNKLSLCLPKGVWFDKIVVGPGEFELNGSAISLQKEELTLINKFMDNLKKDTAFYKDFSSLELGPVQRRTIATYDVLDFTLNGKLK